VPEFRKTESFEDVEVKKETTDALLCVIDGKPHWIPKSQISDDSEVSSEGDEGTLVLSEWISIEKGLV